MHPILAAEAASSNRAGFSRKLSGKYTQRPRMLGLPVNSLLALAHGAWEKNVRQDPIRAIQSPAQAWFSAEESAQARSELVGAAGAASLEGLTASIAHEVNQPLAAIITNGENGLRRLAEPDPDVDRIRELTMRIVADARRAAEIIDRIRGMATRRPSQRTMLSLGEVIKESMGFLRHEFQSSGTSVALDLGSSLPRFLGDKTQIQQVIVNLTVNAIQAMTHCRGVRQAILIRTYLSGSATVCCDVEDSGPGIDPTQLARLFDSFFTTKETGMGIGLAISRSIIEAHDGHIVASNDSILRGARFSFALPASDAV
jgi:signal transduction histidine kinase